MLYKDLKYRAINDTELLMEILDMHLYDDSLYVDYNDYTKIESTVDIYTFGLKVDSKLYKMLLEKGLLENLEDIVYIRVQSDSTW